jgi:hypothetical protein
LKGRICLYIVNEVHREENSVFPHAYFVFEGRTRVNATDILIEMLLAKSVTAKFTYCTGGQMVCCFAER